MTEKSSAAEPVKENQRLVRAVQANNMKMGSTSSAGE